MRVLVVDSDRPERDAIVRSLERAGHRVDEAADPRAGLVFTAREMPETIVLAWPRGGGAEFIRLVRSTASASRPYIVVIVDPASAIGFIYEAGADDFIRRPLVPQELVARAEAPLRIRTWASRRFDLTALRAFQQMGPTIGPELAQMIGGTCQVQETWSPRLTDEPLAATIPFSLSSHGCELRVTIVASRESLAVLAGTMLEDSQPTQEVLEDLLRECANMAGGVLKRASFQELITFTTGIPVIDPQVSPGAPGSRAWTANYDAGRVCLGIIGTVRVLANSRLPIGQLEEGMIVLHDVRNPSGALLVAGGTRLTASLASRLLTVLGEAVAIDVAPGT